MKPIFELSAKIVLASVATVVTVLSIGFYVVMERESERLYAASRERTMTVSRIVREEAEKLFSSIESNRGYLQFLAESLGELKGFSSLAVFDRELKVVAHTKRERIGEAVEPERLHRLRTVLETGLPEFAEMTEGHSATAFIPVKPMDRSGNAETAGVAVLVFEAGETGRVMAGDISAISGILGENVERIFAILREEREGFRSLAEWFSRVGGVATVRIYDVDGKMVSAAGKGAGEETESPAIVLEVISGGAAIEHLEMETGDARVLLPVFTNSLRAGGVREMAGVVELVMDLAPLKGELASLRMNMAATAAALTLAILAILTFLLRKIVVLPVREISKAMEDVSAGDLSRRVEMGTGDELGLLASSFNNMTGELYQSRRDLLSARDYTENILHTMVNSLLVVSSGRKILKGNAAALKLTGYAEEELNGKDISLLFHGDDSPFTDERMGRLMKSGFFRDLESTLFTSGGEPVPVLCFGSVMRGGGGAPEGIVCIAQDMTVRKMVEATLARSLDSLKEAQRIASLGNWDWNIATGRVEWSDEVYRIFGMEKKEFGATYHAFLESVHPDDRQGVIDAVEAAVRGEKEYRIEHRVTRPDGTERMVEETGEVYRDEKGRPLRMLGTVHDITERKEKEAALRRSEERYRNLVESARIIGWEYDWAGERFTFVSGQAEKIMGYPIEKWYERGFWPAHVYPEDRDFAINYCKAATERGEDHEFEYRMIAADGGLVWFQDIVHVRRRENGSTYLHGVLVDISEVKKAETLLKGSYEFLQRLIDTIPNPIFYKDARGLYLGCNRSFETTMGKSRKELLGKSVYDLAPKELADTYAAKDRELYGQQEGAQVYESSIVDAEGNARDVIFNKAIFRNLDGSVGGIVGVILDITERKKAEEEARRARLLAEDASKAKSRLLGNANHELRSPLTGIIGMLKLILEGRCAGAEQEREFVKNIYNSAIHLKGLIEDMLKLTVLETGKMKFNMQDSSLRDVLELARQIMWVRIREKGLELSIDCCCEGRPLYVHADPDRLREVLVNILDNALKFTEKGFIRVSCRECAEGGKALLEIEDSGSGIPPERLGELFQPFSQVEKGKFGGTGLGLSIAKKVMEEMHGDIMIQSEGPGKGTKVTLCLPLSAPAAGEGKESR